MLAVVKTDGTGYRELLRDDIRNLRFNWSWDDQYLLLTTALENRDLVSGDQVSVLSVATGQRYPRFKVPGAQCTKAVFSRDGRYIAYEITPTPFTGGTSRIFIVPAQGGRAREIYSSPPRTVWFGWGTLVDWTADGRYVAIADEYRGKGALYLLPVKEGTAAGSAMFVRYANFMGGHIMPDGSLVYQDQSAKPYAGSDLLLTSLDGGGQIGKWRHLDIRGQAPPVGFNPLPSFSPDGKRIAYRVFDLDETAGQDLDIIDLESGQDRLLYRSTSNLGWCQYGVHQSGSSVSRRNTLGRPTCSPFPIGQGRSELSPHLEIA